MNIEASLFLALPAVALFISKGLRSERTRHLLNLQSLDEATRTAPSTKMGSMAREVGTNILVTLNDNWGKVGIFNDASRARAKALQYGLVGGTTVTCGLLGFLRGGQLHGVVGALVGCYLGALLWLLFLKSQRKEFERRVLFQLPLALEAIILLVESGLGILPAIEQIVRQSKRESTSFDERYGSQFFELQHRSPVHYILHIAYELSAHGMPFSNALELVSSHLELKPVRHVLLHLDISGTEGGELIPSLRSLSDHAHTEWKLSVENRVKRLENLVVFPVFAAVIGLICVTAAVPMIPVLKFRESLRSGATIGSVLNRHSDFGSVLSE